jgi:hypothetical protein
MSGCSPPSASGSIRLSTLDHSIAVPQDWRATRPDRKAVDRGCAQPRIVERLLRIGQGALIEILAGDVDADRRRKPRPEQAAAQPERLALDIVHPDPTECRRHDKSVKRGTGRKAREQALRFERFKSEVRGRWHRAIAASGRRQQ